MKYLVRNSIEIKAAMAVAIRPTMNGPAGIVEAAVGLATLCTDSNERSSGNFSTAAAKIIGVAKRKEKCAASSCERSLRIPAPNVTPVREKPGRRARHCAKPIFNDVDQESGFDISCCSERRYERVRTISIP